MRMVLGRRRDVVVALGAALVAGLTALAHMAVVQAADAADAASGGAPPAEAGPQQIAAWIAELGSAQFARREAASRSLAAAGRPALEPLVQAVRNGDLEVSSRAVEILQEMLDGGDGELSAAAERLLESTAETGQEPVARLAEATLDFHSIGLAAAAREKLEELGASIADNIEFEPGGLEVELGSAWRGSGDDLRHLTHLRGLVAVRVRSAPLDDTAVAVLGRLKTLRRLDLFGTGLGDDAAKRLARKLPESCVVDIRKGGRLGVSPQRMGPPCEIRPVAGSAAERAGVRAGDVVVALAGQAVTDFDSLTMRVSAHGPGERVVLDVLRESPDGKPERLRLEVVLDTW